MIEARFAHGAQPDRLGVFLCMYLSISALRIVSSYQHGTDEGVVLHATIFAWRKRFGEDRCPQVKNNMFNHLRTISKSQHRITYLAFIVGIASALPLYVLAGGSPSSGSSSGGSESTGSSGFTSSEEAGGAIGSSYTMASGSTVTASYSSSEGAYYSRTFDPSGAQVSYSCSNGQSGTPNGNGGWSVTSNEGGYGNSSSGGGSSTTGTTGGTCEYVNNGRGWQYTCNSGSSETCPSGFGLANGACIPLAMCTPNTERGVDGGPTCTCPVGYTYNLNTGSCFFSGCPGGYTQQGPGNSAPVSDGTSKETTFCVITAAIPSCTPRYLCNTDGNIYYEDASCNISSSPTQVCSYGCTGSTCTLPSAPKVVTFSLAPSLVQSGKTTVISWNVANVTDCTVTGSNNPPDTWTQPSKTISWSGSEPSASITGQTIYTLHCTPLPGSVNEDGSAATWTDQTLTVNIVPKFKER